MPSTIELQSTINWASGFIDYLAPTVGTGNEPSITNANTVLQTILGPPFKWSWNRDSVIFTTASGTQDYPSTVSSFGFIESASATLGSTSYGLKEVKQELTIGNETGKPQSIAAQLENSTGLITFRFLPVPDASYNIAVTFQHGAPNFTSLTQSWAPIPDRFSYIYNYGFLALTMAYDDDPRFAIFNQKFVAHLLGTQQGLSETERNLFIDTWNLISRQEFLNQIKSQQGRQALGT